MKKMTILTMLLALGLAGCASNENHIRETVKKNPKIIFDVIEDNPAEFIEVVNRAAQKAQQANYEKQIEEMRNEQEKDLKNPKKPKLDKTRRLLGDDSAKIVLVEYGDFQCPACKMGHGALKQLKEKYREQIQFYFKNMPLDFHKMAYPAALYFEAIRLQSKEKALQFYNHIFVNQAQLTDENFLKKAATKVGANTRDLEKAIASEEIKKIIEEDMNEFQSLGFTGTPVTLINGVALNGAQKFEELERILKLTMDKK